MNVAWRRLARPTPRARLQLGTDSIRVRRPGGAARGDGALASHRNIRGASAPEALDALRAELAGYETGTVEVRLGCAWVRLILLPWAAQLTHDERWHNVARARLDEVLGDDAASWSVRVARDLPGRHRLAAAWPGALHAALADAPQVRSVRIELLEHLGALLSRRARFTGCLAEIDGDRAGFVLLADGRVRRVRGARFDGNEGLVTAMRAEWAALRALDGGVGSGEPALALTPPEALPESPRARTAAALAGALEFRQAFNLREQGD